MFQNVDLTDEEINSLKLLQNSPLIQEGISFYEKVYLLSIKNVKSVRYYRPMKANVKSDVPFINSHRDDVMISYGKKFGLFYAIILNYEKFSFLVDCCEELSCRQIQALDSDAKESVKYTALLNLFDIFIMKDETIMNLILLPYLVSPDDGRLHFNDTIIKKTNALNSFCKRVVFLVYDSIAMAQFFAPSNYNDSNFLGWAKLVHVYQHLLIERGEYNKFKVYHNGEKVLYVNGVKVKPQYFKKLYDLAVEDFLNKFTTIGELVEDVRTVEEVYEKFIERGDVLKGNLVDSYKYQIFDVPANIYFVMVQDSALELGTNYLAWFFSLLAPGQYQYVSDFRVVV
ncbi:hypothetical protein JA1_004454 [Spathaspora sp. JA1]|nr:hypothetical protein JA1_004454 [Spathaspora sp. JA1]